MKKNSLIHLVFVAVCLLVSSCGNPRKGPFDYEGIKEKLSLDSDQSEGFDEITSKYMKQLRAVFEGDGNREEKMNLAKLVSAKQDSEIEKLLNTDQFAIYQFEIKIERGGREKYNMSLIRDELDLDSAQIMKFNLANEAFYTTLRDNHDYYHGKPDVYLQYYKEIDLSRQKVFREILSPEKYKAYQKLEERYKIGKSEH